VKKKTWSEWLNAFLEADAAYHEEHFEERDDWEHMDTMPGGDDFYDDLDDGILESLLIIGLAAALAVLVMYRRRRAEERERQQQQGDNQQPPAQAQQDGGLFPPPGDPEFLGWAAGGIGH
jgi:SEL1 protein